MKRIPLSFFVIGVMLFAYNSYGQTMQLGGGMPPDAPGSKFLNTVNAPAEPAKPASSNENTPSFTGKLAGGLIDISTSWLEIPETVLESSRRVNILAAGTVGVGEGVVLGLGRMLGGIYEITTSVVAPYESPLMAPLYKLDNPDQGFKINVSKW